MLPINEVITGKLPKNHPLFFGDYHLTTYLLNDDELKQLHKINTQKELSVFLKRKDIFNYAIDEVESIDNELDFFLQFHGHDKPYCVTRRFKLNNLADDAKYLAGVVYVLSIPYKLHSFSYNDILARIIESLHNYFNIKGKTMIIDADDLDYSTVNHAYII